MARIKSKAGSREHPRIDDAKVVDFFEERARRVEHLGSLRAVIYQDKHPDLAERRDEAEKEKLLPILDLTPSLRLLDVGCGTGRWAEAVVPLVASYHGIDISPGLVRHARERFEGVPNCRFSVASAADFSLTELGESAPFDIVLCSGVLIYLNDAQAESALMSFANASAPTARILIREPMGLSQRLTLSDHFSEELEQDYHAIYRTEGELRTMVDQRLAPAGFRMLAGGDVYDDPDLNNRGDTRQRWTVLERHT